MKRCLTEVIGAVILILWLAPKAQGAASEAKDMVRVATGVFLMGSNDGPDDERPQHKVDLGAFLIDRVKVTNGAFALFLNAVGPRGPQFR